MSSAAPVDLLLSRQRDAERLLIRLIGLDNLLNSRHGGAGRVPNDTRIGGVFIIVCV